MVFIDHHVAVELRKADFWSGSKVRRQSCPSKEKDWQVIIDIWMWVVAWHDTFFNWCFGRPWAKKNMKYFLGKHGADWLASGNGARFNMRTCLIYCFEIKSLVHKESTVRWGWNGVGVVRWNEVILFNMLPVFDKGSVKNPSFDKVVVFGKKSFVKLIVFWCLGSAMVFIHAATDFCANLSNNVNGVGGRFDVYPIELVPTVNGMFVFSHCVMFAIPCLASILVYLAA